MTATVSTPTASLAERELLVCARPVIFSNADDAFLLTGHRTDVEEFAAEFPREVATWWRSDGSLIVHPAEGYWDGHEALREASDRSGIDVVIEPHGATAERVIAACGSRLMAALVTVWIVRDPTDISMLVDVVWEQKLAGIGDYVRGCNVGNVDAWTKENHTIYTDRDEAIGEALRRLAKARPDYEGRANREAFDVFGYGKAVSS